MNFSIQKIDEKHFPALIELFTEFAHFEMLPHRMTNTVEQMLNEKDFIHGFVALDAENKIVGYATCFFAYYTWIGKSLYMDDLYVKPENRGEGIGTKLIEQIIEMARQNQCKKVRWQVSGWNHPAIAFYKSLGATIESSESNCDLIL